MLQGEERGGLRGRGAAAGGIAHIEIGVCLESMDSVIFCYVILS